MTINEFKTNRKDMEIPQVVMKITDKDGASFYPNVVCSPLMEATLEGVIDIKTVYGCIATGKVGKESGTKYNTYSFRPDPVHVNA